MSTLDSEFFQKLKIVLSKYINGNKKLLQSLMLSFLKIYEEFESPKRFKALNSDSPEIEELRGLLDLIMLDKKSLKDILKELEVIGEEIFLNQYELKLSRIIKQYLKNAEKLTDIQIEKVEINNQISEEKPILKLIDNLSEVIEEFSSNTDIKKIDERRAKEYDASKYKSIDKIKYARR